MMKIKIDDKYLEVYGENGKLLAYFEHFESKNEKKNVIKLSCEDKIGDKFIEQNNYLISMQMFRRNSYSSANKYLHEIILSRRQIT